MNRLLLLAAIAALSGCGVEPAATAATAAQVKKQEMEQAQKNLEQARQKIDEARQLAQQRANSAEQ